MGRIEPKRRVKDWARLAVKLGLVLSEPKIRAAINHKLQDRAEDVTDAIADRYEDVVDRLQAANDALRGRNRWVPGVTGFFVGMGVGAGLGILLAPTASTAADRIGHAISMPPTGTER